MWTCPSFPPGCCITPSGATAPVKTTRNPYYFKVDPEGNQLPYIDSIFYDLANDIQALALKGAAGEIDMMDRHINTNANKPVFVDNMKKGDYSLFEEVPASMNQMIISFNLTHKDKARRAVYQDLNFRIGRVLRDQPQGTDRCRLGWPG